jgi:hypothetical protein
MKVLFSIFTAAALCTAYGQGTFEAIQGYNTTVATVWEGTAGGTFTVTNTIKVTALGAFNYLFALNGGPIEVGLWDSAGNLIASNSISSTSPPFNQSRYQSINPVTLNPNQLYSIGAFDPSGAIFLNIAGSAAGGTVTNAPQIVLGNYAEISGGFAAPTAVTNTLGTIYLGGNFEFTEDVPEPASGALLGVAGLLFAAYRYRRS